ncbi:MAG: Sec-independent protein translocase subunit TatA [Pseudomonadales bacterium]|nr:Sec-independent protein translocase subunit TatA [Pseudomonadales bacterium]
MGLGGIGIWQLVIILVIIMMLFGTKKLRNMGSDIGGALKGFKQAMKDDKGDDGESEKTDDKLMNESVEPTKSAESTTAKREAAEDK